jgi:hypothetical protein
MLMFANALSIVTTSLLFPEITVNNSLNRKASTTLVKQPFQLKETEIEGLRTAI